MALSKHKTLKADEFDAAFEEGDISEHFHLKSAKARYLVQRIIDDFPVNIKALFLSLSLKNDSSGWAGGVTIIFINIFLHFLFKFIRLQIN